MVTVSLRTKSRLKVNPIRRTVYRTLVTCGAKPSELAQLDTQDDVEKLGKKMGLETSMLSWLMSQDFALSDKGQAFKALETTRSGADIPKFLKQAGIPSGKLKGPYYDGAAIDDIAKQLVALCIQIKKRRVLRDAAWAIWWDGYWVEKNWILRRLVTQLARIEPFFLAWVGDERETSEDPVEQLVSQTQEKRLPAPLGTIRRSLGQEAFTTFMVLLSRAFGGDLPVLSDLEGEPEIVAKGFGSDEARASEVNLQAASKALNFHRLRDALAAVTIEELCEARDEVRDVLNDCYRVLADILKAVGLSRIALFSRALDPSAPANAANALLVWLPLRRNPRARRLYELGSPLFHQVANGEMSLTEAFERYDQLVSEDSRND